MFNNDRMNDSLQLLAETRKLINNCMDYEATIKEVANLLVSTLAEWCSIDLVSADNKIIRVAVTHRDPTKANLAKEILEKYPASPSAKRGVYKVIETGQSILIPRVSESSWARRADNPRHLELIMSLGSTSYMCIPLLARGRTIGSIMILSGERVFDESDLHTGEELASTIALAMDNVQMFKNLQSAVKVRDEFLATLSHELRTPLNIILGWINILKTEKLGEQELQKAFEILERNSLIQTRMINDLLDLNRILSKKLPVKLQPIDLTTILVSCTESLSIDASIKKITFQIDNALMPITILGDAAHLHRMLMNLLTNAIKFTPTHGIINIKLETNKNKAIITVKDNGIGILPEFIPFVFEAFRQENGSTTRTHQGLGLGLAISKHIVETHHGSISVKSEGKGKGAEFTICLPLLLSPDLFQTGTDLMESQTADSICLNGKKILIVDDCEDIRQLFKLILERAHAEVVTAESPFQGLEMMKTYKPDILISDISMPDMDGYDFIKIIRSLPEGSLKNIAAIALTAYAKDTEEKKSLAAGFDMHISKPVSAKDLQKFVYKLCLEKSPTASQLHLNNSFIKLNI
ncbi:MAG: ATP-binding protein [Bdellovibrio sp.]